MGVLSYAEELLYFVIEWGILLLELFGVIILAYTSISCFVKWIRKEQNIRLELAQGITLALSFKMGGEVLRTRSSCCALRSRCCSTGRSKTRSRIWRISKRSATNADMSIKKTKNKQKRPDSLVRITRRELLTKTAFMR